MFYVGGIQLCLVLWTTKKKQLYDNYSFTSSPHRLQGAHVDDLISSERHTLCRVPSELHHWEKKKIGSVLRRVCKPGRIKKNSLLMLLSLKPSAGFMLDFGRLQTVHHNCCSTVLLPLSYNIRCYYSQYTHILDVLTSYIMGQREYFFFWIVQNIWLNYTNILLHHIQFFNPTYVFLKRLNIFEVSQSFRLNHINIFQNYTNKKCTMLTFFKFAMSIEKINGTFSFLEYNYLLIFLKV